MSAAGIYSAVVCYRSSFFVGSTCDVLHRMKANWFWTRLRSPPLANTVVKCQPMRHHFTQKSQLVNWKLLTLDNIDRLLEGGVVRSAEYYRLDNGGGQRRQTIIDLAPTADKNFGHKDECTSGKNWEKFCNTKSVVGDSCSDKGIGSVATECRRRTELCEDEKKHIWLSGHSVGANCSRRNIVKV
ncbi:unnamed protein product [Ceratitis capitata]|uniref:(Mediterranean fruit fly) hypothetical protein n=1 Tax=Ceratitis capitata TaxID=7213 RepID=A0A811UEY6_CERCA|nr:unnamed protein product [Ceratitis capitata]